jgi:two-component sensor histidine kinase
MPDIASSPPKPSRRWLLLGAAATIPTLLSTFETVMFSRLGRRPFPVWKAFLAEAPQWYGWALLVPPIVALGQRFPLRRPLRAHRLVVHALASLVAGLLVAIASAVINSRVRPSPAGLVAMTRNWFVGQLPATTVVYFAIVGVSYAFASSAELRERQRQAADLEARLRDAQLAALRMQLQPHFLFNSLNAIMALVRDQDTQRAIRALSLLSDVLRATVNTGNAHETTLEGEIDFVTRYLEIERVRFGDRLRFVVDVPPDLHDTPVPIFVLQPFVENSLKHGVLQGRAANTIEVRARADDGVLELTVADDGRGLSPTAAPNGVGITNARARLETMYGSRGIVTIDSRAEGTGVVARIPLHRENGAHPA